MRKKTLAVFAVLGSPLSLAWAAMMAPKVILILSGLAGLLLGVQSLVPAFVILSLFVGVPLAFIGVAIVAL
jgi:hypothetical protein